MAKQIYAHNSVQKDAVRQKWIEFASEFYEEERGLSVISFPSDELHELELYRESGLIDWDITETGGRKITRGKIVCFEKEGSKFKTITKKLVNARVESGEYGFILRAKYNSIMGGQTSIFPVDIVNLDYDGCISRINVPISETIERTFQYQGHHQKSFSLFMTWPNTEDEDLDEYKNSLREVIEENLQDSEVFRERFETEYAEIQNLDYEQLSIIGMVKLIFRNSSLRKFKLTNSNFLVYGGTHNRRRMFSILLNFNFVGQTMTKNQIYSQDVTTALTAIEDLNQ